MSVLKKNIAFNALLSISQILFPLVSFPYASRVLGPEAIGSVNFVDNFTTYFLIFSALGIPLYGIREISKVKHDSVKLGKVFSELIVIHIFTSLMSVLILSCLIFYVPRMTSNVSLYQVGMAIIVGTVFVSEWFFQGIEKFRYIALRSISIRVITIGLLFLFVHSAEDKVIYYSLNLITVIFSALTNSYAISKIVKFSFRKLELLKHLKTLLLIFSTNVITTIYLVFDSIILGFLTNDTAVGYYSAAMRIGKLSLALIGVMSTVLLPRLTLAFQSNNLSDVSTLLAKSMNFVVFLGIPIAVGIYCLSDEIILIFAGKAYLPAASSLQILCFIVIFVGLAQIFSQQILLPLHQEKKILYASLFGVVTSLALNFSLIPIFSHRGAAISSLATELCVTLFLYFFCRKHIKIDLPGISFLQSCITSFCFIFIKYAVQLLTGDIFITVIMTFICSGLFYLLMQVYIWKNIYVLEVLSNIPVLRFLTKKSANE